jgi:hypothetical protein
MNFQRKKVLEFLVKLSWSLQRIRLGNRIPHLQEQKTIRINIVLIILYSSQLKMYWDISLKYSSKKMKILKFQQSKFTNKSTNPQEKQFK